MTLRRLLVAGVTLAFLAVLAGVEAIAVRNAQNALQQQLEAHAQQTATSLALTLGAVLKGTDAALAETVINPVFDRGYYSEIRLLAVDGREMVARRLAPGVAEVPAWFRGAFRLQAPAGEALVSAGWRQLGRVVVTVHPEFAYRQLWRSAYETLAWFALLYFVALFAVSRYVAGILRPLDAIERAAVAISNRDFRPVAAEAPTTELRRVATAINVLAAKMSEAIAHETARAERILEDSYRDPVTQQLNRRGFRQRVRALMAGETDISSGVLAVFSLHGLQDVNRAEGTAAGDALLRAVGASLREPLEGREPLVGREEGAAFAVFVAHLAGEPAAAWVRAACERARAHYASVVAGGVRFEGARPEPDELEHWAQVALARALHQGTTHAVLDFDAGVHAGEGAGRREAIERALAAGRIALFGQKVLGLPGGEVLHTELTLALAAADGSLVSGASFLPAAAQAGLLPRVDSEVAKRLAASATSPGFPAGRIALNVAARSMADPGYLEVLTGMLARQPALARRLVLEANAYGAAHDAAATERFARTVRASGAEFALDDVELSPDALVLARRLLPLYVKLAPSYARDIAERAEAKFLLESLIAILRPLEVPVIVKGVEETALVELLARAGAGGYQGYAGDRPARVA